MLKSTMKLVIHDNKISLLEEKIKILKKGSTILSWPNFSFPIVDLDKRFRVTHK